MRKDSVSHHDAHNEKAAKRKATAINRFLNKLQQKADFVARDPDVLSFIALTRRALSLPDMGCETEGAYSAWSSAALKAAFGNKVSTFGFIGGHELGKMWADLHGDRRAFEELCTAFEAKWGSPMSSDESPFKLLDNAANYMVEMANLDYTWQEWAKRLIIWGDTTTQSVVKLVEYHRWAQAVYRTPDMTRDVWMAIYDNLEEREKHAGDTPPPIIDPELKALRTNLGALRAEGKSLGKLLCTIPGARLMDLKGLTDAPLDRKKLELSKFLRNDGMPSDMEAFPA